MSLQVLHEASNMWCVASTWRQVPLQGWLPWLEVSEKSCEYGFRGRCLNHPPRYVAPEKHQQEQNNKFRFVHRIQFTPISSYTPALPTPSPPSAPPPPACSALHPRPPRLPATGEGKLPPSAAPPTKHAGQPAAAPTGRTHAPHPNRPHPRSPPKYWHCGMSHSC